MDERRFIIWDHRDGEVRWGEPGAGDEGKIISDGVIGRVGLDNVYLTAYAEYQDERRPYDLEVGQYLVARFSLSGTVGYYRIYRVE